MKTELMLLIQTNGCPTMNVSDMGKLLNVTQRSVLNRIYKQAMPFPVFKLADSGEWVAHVSDVASHIDTQRDQAAKLMQ
jgi:hypothetical protein